MGLAIKLVRIAGILCAVAALAPLTLALVFYWHENKFIRQSVLTRGVVVAMHRNIGHLNTGQDEFPVFTFRDKARRLIQIDSMYGSYPPAYRVGEKVPVRYRPSDPTDAMIASPVTLWLGTIISGAFAVAFLLGAAILLVAVRPLLGYAGRKFNWGSGGGQAPLNSTGYSPPPPQ